MKEALEGYGVDLVALARPGRIDPESAARSSTPSPASSMAEPLRLAPRHPAIPTTACASAASRAGDVPCAGLGIVSSSSVLSALQRIERYSSV